MPSDMNLPGVEFRGDYMPLSANALIDNDSIIHESLESKFLSRVSSSLEEHDVMTPFNFSVKVFVKRSNRTTPIVTFHDIGTNHNSFLGFFNYREMKVLLKHFTVYHICAPGHSDREATIDMNNLNTEEKNTLLSSLDDPQISTNSFKSTRSHSIGSSSLGSLNSTRNVRYPNLDELAQIVNSVVTHFGLKFFIGFGMGAGSNILCRYTLRHQDNVRALFLLNPDASVHGYYEWFKLRWFDIPSMKRDLSITDDLMNFLESHWFGFGQNGNPEVSQYYEQIAKNINPANLAGFVDAWLTRTDLGLVRIIGPDSVKNQDFEKNIRADVCLVTGALSSDLARTLSNMNGRMDPAKTQFLILEDCNGMLMEERPDKLAVNFLYFLRTIGLLINLQPETLLREAEELQNQESDALQNADFSLVRDVPAIAETIFA